MWLHFSLQTFIKFSEGIMGMSRDNELFKALIHRRSGIEMKCLSIHLHNHNWSAQIELISWKVIK